MTRRRTRPDTSGKPGYITPDGYRRFEEEADRLWNVDRPKMAKAVQVAAAEGDRSENAEYQYSKQRLAAIDQLLDALRAREETASRVDKIGLRIERFESAVKTSLASGDEPIVEAGANAPLDPVVSRRTRSRRRTRQCADRK